MILFVNNNKGILFLGGIADYLLAPFVSVIRFITIKLQGDKYINELMSNEKVIVESISSTLNIHEDKDEEKFV